MDQRVSRRTRREPQSPQYVARAKVGNGWTNIGAAWPLRSGDDGLSVQLTTTPLNWDGRFVLLPPLQNGDEREPVAEDERTPPF
jgi:hypothetical protein